MTTRQTVASPTAEPIEVQIVPENGKSEPVAGLTPDDLAALAAPLPLESGHSVRIAQTGDTWARWLTYTEEEPVKERLDQVDPNWSFTIISVRESGDVATVIARLAVKGVVRDCIGSGSVKGEDRENFIKAAATDAFKRGARLFGVGLYLKNAPPIFTNWVEIDKGMTGEERKQAKHAQNQAADEAFRQFANWYRHVFNQAPSEPEERDDQPESPDSQAAPAMPAAKPKQAARASKTDQPAQPGPEAAPATPAAKPKQADKTGKTNRPDPDQPWKQVIANWTQKNWNAYWSEMKGRGLTSADVHDALGVTSVLEFTGTRAQHHALIRAKEAELKHNQQQPGHYDSSASYGTAVLSRVVACPTEATGFVSVTVYVLGTGGAEDTLPLLTEEMDITKLRKLFPGTPRVLSGEQTLYELPEDADIEDALKISWKREGTKVVIDSLVYD